MNRAILALFTSLATLTLAAFTTKAVWSDTLTINENQILTGTANLEISTDRGNSWNNSSGTSPINLSNLIPGGTVNGYSFSLLNSSSTEINLKLQAKITALNISGSDTPNLNHLQIAIYDCQNTPETGSGWLTASEWQLEVKEIESVLRQGSSNIKHYCLAAKLSNNASNEWQLRTINFVITVTGEQE